MSNITGKPHRTSLFRSSGSQKAMLWWPILVRFHNIVICCQADKDRRFHFNAPGMIMTPMTVTYMPKNRIAIGHFSIRSTFSWTLDFKLFKGDNPWFLNKPLFWYWPTDYKLYSFRIFFSPCLWHESKENGEQTSSRTTIQLLLKQPDIFLFFLIFLCIINALLFCLQMLRVLQVTAVVYSARTGTTRFSSSGSSSSSASSSSLSSGSSSTRRAEVNWTPPLQPFPRFMWGIPVILASATAQPRLNECTLTLHPLIPEIQLQMPWPLTPGSIMIQMALILSLLLMGPLLMGWISLLQILTAVIHSPSNTNMHEHCLSRWYAEKYGIYQKIRHFCF